MPILPLNKPVEQPKPVLLVENPLPAGLHRFELVVVNGRGVASEPVVIAVRVQRAIVVGPTGPTRPDIGVVRPRRPRAAKTSREGKNHGPE